jgi:peptidoglycan/xylan/chitin deacetylase (PgdA/CDA1 family)
MNGSSEPRFISFCFDDGYEKSCRAIADIFEGEGASASFCVLTDPAGSADDYVRSGRIGDFELWRALAARGHEVMPHGHHHIHLGTASEAEAKAEIEACLRLFCERMQLSGPSDLIYHCAYNHILPSLADWLQPQVRAIRASEANIGTNPVAWNRTRSVFDACFPLPPAIDTDARTRIANFITSTDAWLTLCFHGLDDEGWGPLPADALRAIIREAVGLGATIMPPGMVIRALASV